MPLDCNECEKGSTKKGCREVCYDAQLYRHSLDTACEQKLTATDVFYRYKDSVVTVSAFYPTATVESGLPTQTLYSTVGGFIIRVDECLYIVAPSYIAVSQGGFLQPAAGTFLNSWFATVKNANLEGCNVIYQLSLVGVSGRGDTALFRIDYNTPWNCKLRKLKHHPYLQWSDSRQAAIGSTVYLFDHSTGVPSFVYAPSSSARSVTEVTLADNRYVDPSGLILYEGVEVQSAPFLSHFGSPVITQSGTVIGMIANSSDGAAGGSASSGLVGPSQNYMAKVIKELLSGRDLFTVCEGGVARYLNPYPGVFPVGTFGLPPINAVPGFRPLHAFGVEDLLSAPGGPMIGSCYKGVQGFVFNGSTDATNPYSAHLFNECPLPIGGSAVVAPFVAGDILFGVDCCILGTLPPQVSFWTAHADVPAGSPIKVTYLTRANCYSCPCTACVVFTPIPPEADLPTFQPVVVVA